jgi:hypothetical protein
VRTFPTVLNSWIRIFLQLVKKFPDFTKLEGPYHVHKNPPVVYILSQINPVHILHVVFWTHCNITLQSMSRPQVSNYKFVHIYNSSTPCSSNPLWICNQNNFWWRAFHMTRNINNNMFSSHNPSLPLILPFPFLSILLLTLFNQTVLSHWAKHWRICSGHKRTQLAMKQLSLLVQVFPPEVTCSAVQETPCISDTNAFTVSTKNLPLIPISSSFKRDHALRTCSTNNHFNVDLTSTPRY